MTDEEIIALAEKTKKNKYCKQHQYIEDGYPWCGDCPITYEGYECTDLYSTPFLDGFKAAIGFVKSKVSDVRKEYEYTDDFTYEAGGKDALNDLLEAIER